MGYLRKFLSLPVSLEWLLLKAWLMVAFVRVSLWLIPFRLLRALLRRWESKQPRRLQGEAAEHVAWAVRAAGRFVPCGRHCLTQSLAAATMLARRGHHPRVHIGVKRERDASVMGHAWVAVEGVVMVGNHGLDQYTELKAQGQAEHELPGPGQP